MSECNDLALIQIDDRRRLPYLDWYDGDITRRPRRLRRRLPARRPRVHADPWHRRQGRGRWRHHRHVVDRPHRRARRQHPARQLRRPARVVRRRRSWPSTTPAGRVRHPAVLRHRLRPRPAGRRPPAGRRLRVARRQRVGRRRRGAGLSGIWVAGVTPGRPAADAALLPGDIVTSMNGLPVGSDGTFKDYCDVIRTAGEGNADRRRGAALRHLGGAARRDQRRRADRAVVLLRRRGRRRGRRGRRGRRAGRVPVRVVTDDLGRIEIDVPTAWTDRNTAPSTARGREPRRRTSPPPPTSTASSTGGRIRVCCTPRSPPARTSTTC